MEVELKDKIDVDSSQSALTVDVVDDSVLTLTSSERVEVYINDKIKVEQDYPSITTTMEMPTSEISTLFTDFQQLRDNTLAALAGQTAAVIDEVMYQIDNAEDGIRQTLERISVDYISTGALDQYALTEELSTHTIAREYAIDRWTGNYVQDRSDWGIATVVIDDVEVDADQYLTLRKMCTASGDQTAAEVADDKYPLSDMPGDRGWYQDENSNDVVYTEDPGDGYVPAYHMYTSITSQDIYDKAVRVEFNQASYSEDIRAFADEQTAYAERLTELSAISDGHEVRINTIGGVMIGSPIYYFHDYPSEKDDYPPAIGEIAVFADGIDGDVRTDEAYFASSDERMEYTGTVATPPKDGWDGWQITMQSEISKVINQVDIKVNELQQQIDQTIDTWFMDGLPYYTEDDATYFDDDDDTSTDDVPLTDLVTDTKTGLRENVLVWVTDELQMYKYLDTDDRDNVDLTAEDFSDDAKWSTVWKEPEATWRNTDSDNDDNVEKHRHAKDLYYDNIEGQAYRYTESDYNTSTGDGIWSWLLVADGALTEALQRASEAQATADGKMSFYGDPTMPELDNIENCVGDVWSPSATSYVEHIHGLYILVDDEYVLADPDNTDTRYKKFTTGEEYVLTYFEEEDVYLWEDSVSTNAINSILNGTSDISSASVNGVTLVDYIADPANTGTDNMINVYTVTSMTDFNKDDEYTVLGYGDLLNVHDGVTVTSYTYARQEETYLTKTANPTADDEYIKVDESDEYDAMVGLLWYNAVDLRSFIFIKTVNSEDDTKYDYTYETTEDIWKEVQGISNLTALEDLEDSKKSIYSSAATPTGMNVNDVWFTPNTVTDSQYNTNSMYIAEYNADGTLVWVETPNMISLYDTLQAQSDAQIVLIPSPTEPEGHILGDNISEAEYTDMRRLLGDIWQDTNTGRQYEYKAAENDTDPVTYTLWWSEITGTGTLASIASNLDVKTTIYGGDEAPIDEYLEDGTGVYIANDEGYQLATQAELDDTSITKYKRKLVVGDLWFPSAFTVVEDDEGNYVASGTEEYVLASSDELDDDSVQKYTAIYIKRFMYTWNGAVWTLSSNYTDDSFINQIVNGEVPLNGKLVRIETSDGAMSTLDDYVANQIDEKITVYSGTNAPGELDSNSYPTRQEVRVGDIYVHLTTTQTALPGVDAETTMAESVTYTYAVGSASGVDLDAGRLLDDSDDAQWVRQDGAGLAQLADTVDNKREIYTASSVDSFSGGLTYTKEGVTYSKIRYRDILIIENSSLGGVVYEESATGAYIHKKVQVFNEEKTELLDDNSAWSLNSDNEWYLTSDSSVAVYRSITDEYMLGVYATTYDDESLTTTYNKFVDGDVLYYGNSNAVSSQDQVYDKRYWTSESRVAQEVNSTHWTAGTSQFITHPDTGAITGWSMVGGSGLQSEFVIRADKFKVESDVGAEIPFEVYADSDGNTKIKLTGAVSFEDQFGENGTTSIDGGRITTGTVDTDRLNIGNLSYNKTEDTCSGTGMYLDDDLIVIGNNSSIRVKIGLLD